MDKKSPVLLNTRLTDPHHHNNGSILKQFIIAVVKII